MQSLDQCLLQLSQLLQGKAGGFAHMQLAPGLCRKLQGSSRMEVPLTKLS